MPKTGDIIRFSDGGIWIFIEKEGSHFYWKIKSTTNIKEGYLSGWTGIKEGKTAYTVLGNVLPALVKLGEYLHKEYTDDSKPV